MSLRLPFLGKARGVPLLPSGTVQRSVGPSTLQQALGLQGSVSDQLGPGQPAVPTPLDGSRLPRQFQYRPGYNLPSVPGEGRLGFGTLQSLADLYDILRKAIEVRKDEVTSLRWDIAPLSSDLRERRALTEKNKAKLEAARTFFRKPDRVMNWQGWVRMLLEDYLVLDAVSLYKRRTYGGDLYALDILSGDTIKPLLTLQGRTPEPPAPAYQQYLYGLARDEFTTDDLLYKPKNRRARTPYGFSNVEQFATHINLALRWQIFNVALFTDGNVPAMLVSAPEGWQADQIEEYMQLWDALISGNQAEQRKLKMLPPGSKLVLEHGDLLNYSKDFADYLLTITCVAMDVTRQELGLEPANTNGLGGSGHAEAQERVQFRRSLSPLCAWLADDILTPVVQEDLGLPDFGWVWPDLLAQDEQTQAQTNQVLLTSGQKSLDDILMEQGQAPEGIDRFVLLGSTVYFMEDLKQLSKTGVLAQQQQAAQEMATQQHEQALEQTEQQASLAQKTAPGKTAQKAADPDEDGRERRQDLARWRTKALKAQGAGKGAGVPFASPALDDYTRWTVERRLGVAVTADQVKAAFAGLETAQLAADAYEHDCQLLAL